MTEVSASSGKSGRETLLAVASNIKGVSARSAVDAGTAASARCGGKTRKRQGARIRGAPARKHCSSICRLRCTAARAPAQPSCKRARLSQGVTLVSIEPRGTPAGVTRRAMAIDRTTTGRAVDDGAASDDEEESVFPVLPRGTKGEDLPARPQSHSKHLRRLAAPGAACAARLSAHDAEGSSMPNLNKWLVHHGGVSAGGWEPAHKIGRGRPAWVSSQSGARWALQSNRVESGTRATRPRHTHPHPPARWPSRKFAHYSHAVASAA